MKRLSGIAAICGIAALAVSGCRGGTAVITGPESPLKFTVKPQTKVLTEENPINGPKIVAVRSGAFTTNAAFAVVAAGGKPCVAEQEFNNGESCTIGVEWTVAGGAGIKAQFVQEYGTRLLPKARRAEYPIES